MMLHPNGHCTKWTSINDNTRIILQRNHGEFIVYKEKNFIYSQMVAF